MPPLKRSAPTPESIEGLLDSLEHPFKREILEVRRIILGADPAISEGVKWNAPSFRTTEWFATVHLRARDAVQVILHLGAKAREGVPKVDDPSALLAWLGKDRASVKFRDMDDVKAKREHFTAIVRQWVANLP